MPVYCQGLSAMIFLLEKKQCKIFHFFAYHVQAFSPFTVIWVFQQNIFTACRESLYNWRKRTTSLSLSLSLYLLVLIVNVGSIAQSQHGSDCLGAQCTCCKAESKRTGCWKGGRGVSWVNRLKTNWLSQDHTGDLTEVNLHLAICFISLFMIFYFVHFANRWRY